MLENGTSEFQLSNFNRFHVENLPKSRVKPRRSCFAISFSLLIIPRDEWSRMIRAAIYDLFYRLFGSWRIFWSIDRRTLFLKMIVLFSIFYLFAKIKNFTNLNFFLNYISMFNIQMLTKIFMDFFLFFFFFISFYLKYLYLIISQTYYLELKIFFKINHFFNVLFYDLVLYFYHIQIPYSIIHTINIVVQHFRFKQHTKPW